MKKLPKTIYIQRDNEGTQNEWLRAETDFADFTDDGQIGIYELKEIKNRTTKHSLE